MRKEVGVEEADRSLLEAVAAGHIRSAARLITRIERDDREVVPILQTLYRQGGRGKVVGVTGPPGAGKSTLINALVRHWRQAGLKVAVLAVDPSSPFSGGAVLGDRLRMMDHSGDAGVFIRSMATRGQHGGLARATRDAVTVLAAAGYDVILVDAFDRQGVAPTLATDAFFADALARLAAGGILVMNIAGRRSDRDPLAARLAAAASTRFSRSRPLRTRV